MNKILESFLDMIKRFELICAYGFYQCRARYLKVQHAWHLIKIEACIKYYSDKRSELDSEENDLLDDLQRILDQEEMRKRYRDSYNYRDN